MKQLNQILIEGLLARSTPDVYHLYHLSDDRCFSLTVYIVKDTVKEKLRKEIQDKAKIVCIVGSLKRLDNMYYIDAESVEVKP